MSSKIARCRLLPRKWKMNPNSLFGSYQHPLRVWSTIARGCSRPAAIPHVYYPDLVVDELSDGLPAKFPFRCKLSDTEVRLKTSVDRDQNAKGGRHLPIA